MPYRPPELFDPAVGSVLDCRTDVWSLGCLLFAWWYGNSPFESEFMYPDSAGSGGGSGSGSGGGAGREMTSVTGDTHFSTPAEGREGAAGYTDTQQAYQMKVVPCSHLRVLSSLPRRHSHPPPLRHPHLPLPPAGDRSSALIDELVQQMVAQSLADRPFIAGVRAAVQRQIAQCGGHSGAGCDV